MNWAEVARIIETKMSCEDRAETARVDIHKEDSVWVTEMAIKLIKDTYGVWTFVVGGADDHNNACPTCGSRHATVDSD